MDFGVEFGAVIGSQLVPVRLRRIPLRAVGA